MKTNKYWYIVLCSLVLAITTSCEPKALEEKDVFTPSDNLAQELAAENPEGYKIYDINELLNTFMTEEGSFKNDSCPYRQRSTVDNKIFLFTIDTIPTAGEGIYIRGRIISDDYAGNFYKSLVIQQVVNNQQQSLRISVDLGSAGGMFQIGQELLIRCNGLSIGRYANQPQLCVPSYNDNIYAMNANEKVGWAPGRIPPGRFRDATRLIGVPDQSKIKYDTLTLTELYNQTKGLGTFTNDTACMNAIRKADGRLVVIKGIWFNGQYDDNGTEKDCEVANPDSAGSANVFAPTTNNIGYPQSRVITDASGKKLMSQCSEYAKFAYYYLPGADHHGTADCVNWKGTITGILGFYEDKAADLSKINNTNAWKEWSVTPRGIPGIGIEDIKLYKEVEQGEYELWTPREYTPNLQ